MLNKKKLIILMSILVGVFVILLALYLFVDKEQNKKDYKANLGVMTTQIFSFDPLTTNNLTITNTDGVFSFQYNFDGNNWSPLLSSVDFEHNDYILNQIAYNLSNLSSLGTVTENAEDLSAYGLDNPYKIETTLTDGKVFTLLLGNISPANDFYYGMLPNAKIIYKFDVIIAQLLIASKNELKNVYIMDTDLKQIDYLHLERDGKTIFEMKANDTFFDFIAPIRWKLDFTEASNVLNAAIRSQALQIVAEGDNVFSEYGFDKPFAIFTIKSKDGKERTVTFINYNPVTLNIYGYYDNMVLEFYTGDVDYLWEDTLELLDTVVYEETYMKDVDTLTFEYDGVDAILDITPNAVNNANLDLSWKYKNINDGEYTEIPILTSEQRDVMYKLYIALLSVEFSTIDPDVPIDFVGFRDSYLKISLKRNNAPYNVDIEYIRKDDTNFYVIIDGKYSGVTARLKEFEQTDRLIPVWNSMKSDFLK
ncbi:hypothetical protein FACS1894132_03860 [Clostridia bacterium]|nr:hypothetical protein FACS1894132_03860 [Clostridia bacterium]